MSVLDRLGSLVVSDVMSRHVVTVGACDGMESAAARLLELGVSSAPAINESGMIVGILTASDFLRRDSSCLSRELGETQGSEPLSVEERLDRVASFMSTAIQSVQSNDLVLRAARIMTDSHLHRLPVMDGRQVVGMISTLDVVAALLNAVDESAASV